MSRPAFGWCVSNMHTCMHPSTHAHTHICMSMDTCSCVHAQVSTKATLAVESVSLLCVPTDPKLVKLSCDSDWANGDSWERQTPAQVRRMADTCLVHALTTSCGD